jgi:hypothetical protein
LAGDGESEQLSAGDKGGIGGAKFGMGRLHRGKRIGGFLKGAERKGGVGLGGNGQLGAGGIGAGGAAAAVEQRDGDLGGDKAAERTGAKELAQARAGEEALGGKPKGGKGGCAGFADAGLLRGEAGGGGAQIGTAG